ncbi:MAG: Calcium-binding acidic-repeat protein precursor [Pseudobdellovibrio sp.]|nr:Calcium-binding acidic-repeat protein precursor [Pseudobdellovibrio sp.]
MMIFKKPAFLICAVLALVLSFQNCSDVKVELASEVPIKPFASVNMSAEGCVNSVQMAPEKTKFVFIIDLSRSNMGAFYKGDYNFNGTVYPNYNYWRASDATDAAGARFDALANFVSTCGNSTNADYSVIAFSNGAGEISKNSNGVHTLTCQNRFINSTQVNAQLSMMKAAQLQEAAYYTKFDQANNFPFLSQHTTEVAPFLFKETNYVAATDCLASTIEADMAVANNETSNYQVFFLSDGEAQAKASGCEETTIVDKAKCYIEKMDEKLSYLLKLSSAKSKPIRVHALYYTKSGTQNLGIETFMNYLAAVGQTTSPINLGSFQASSPNAENPFCKLLAVDKSIVYRTNKIYPVNLTSIKVGTVLKRDSDADGITDDEETSFGASESDARSMVPGVLDGICKMIGNKQLCMDERNKITCDVNKINKFGISDCDVKILKLNTLALRPELVGIDSDNDGIPDYIEILKGTSPINMDSYLDMDNDGLNNLQEINAGLDPFTPDANADKVIYSESLFKDVINQCTSGGWHLDLTSLGGVEGQNKLMLFFRTESKNTVGVFEYRVYKTSYEVISEPKVSFSVSLQSGDVSPDQFQLVLPEVSQ